MPIYTGKVTDIEWADGMSNSRVARGHATERMVASHLAANGWPYATVTRGAGVDVANTPGLAVEVKARRDMDLTGWLRQATRVDRAGVPLVIARPDGYGPSSIDSWPMILTLKDGIWLLRKAGFGESES